MIRILSVGNSFSQDAHAFLHDLSAAGGVDVLAANLYIGGCSLETHYKNMTEDKTEYSYEINGIPTGETVSLGQAFEAEDWDFITFQQASHDSGIPETYFPYLPRLISYSAGSSPRSVKLLHQTWAYETDSDHDAFSRYGNDQHVMYSSLKDAYSLAADVTGLCIIPSGEVIQTLRSYKEFDYPDSGLSLCRDGFHLDLIYGRFAAAATWYESITHKDVRENPFVPQSDGNTADGYLSAVIRETVHKVCLSFT